MIPIVWVTLGISYSFVVFVDIQDVNLLVDLAGLREVIFVANPESRCIRILPGMFNLSDTLKGP